MKKIPSNTPGALYLGRIPADKADSNNDSTNVCGPIIIEVIPANPDESEAPLYRQDNEDPLADEARTNANLIFWIDGEDPSRAFIRKNSAGEEGWVDADYLNELLDWFAQAQPTSVEATEEPPTSLTLESEPTPPDDGASLSSALVLTRTESAGINDLGAVRMPAAPDVVIQAKRGADGHMYRLSGERLSQEALDAAHYVYNFESGGLATVHKNAHGRAGRTRASVASIDAAKALRLADREAVRKLAEETRAIVLPRKNGPSASLADYARTFAAVTLWPKILDDAHLSSEDLDALISRVNDTIFHRGLKYARGSIGIQVPSPQVEVTLCGTADAAWCWPGDRTSEEIAGLGLLRALKAYRQARNPKGANPE
jgi:hypothetical protein